MLYLRKLGVSLPLLVLGYSRKAEAEHYLPYETENEGKWYSRLYGNCYIYVLTIQQLHTLIGKVRLINTSFKS